MGTVEAETISRRSPAEEYTGPPKQWFFGEEWFARDLEAIWRPRWLFAGHVDELDAGGRHGYITFSLDKWEVVIRRDENRRVRAFYNVCPHRGARLCDGRNGSAPTKRVVCPYHQWTFSVDDGRLINSRLMHPDFDQEPYGLFPAHVDLWNGLIFVCFADQAPQPFSEHIGSLDAEGYDLEHMKLAATSSHVINANWKIVVDNDQECYHCALSHPELCSRIDWKFLGDDDFDVDAFGEERAAGSEVFRFDLPAPILTVDGTPACRVPLRRHPGEPELDFSVQLNWEPGVDFILSRESAWMFVPIPLGPERTELRQYWFVDRDAEEGRDYEIEALKRLLNTTMLQDRPLCERVQAGMENPAYRPGPLNRVHQPNNAGFFRWYEQRIIERFPEAVV